jgi:hypothetical protein
MFSASPTRAACLNFSGSRKRRSGRKQCTNDVVGRLLRLILNDPLDPLDLYFLIGLKESMMPVSCLWQFTLNHSLPFWALSLYVSLFWSDTPVQMAHLAVWNGLRFMTVEHIPENASIQELSSVCNSASNANKSQSLNTSPKGPSNAKTEQCSAGAIDSDGSALPLNCKLPFICKFPIAPRLRGRAWRHNFAN